MLSAKNFYKELAIATLSICSVFGCSIAVGAVVGYEMWYKKRHRHCRYHNDGISLTTKPYYFDYNATTPVDPEVAAAMEPYLFLHFGNPSSSHIYGIAAKEAVTFARKQVGSLLQANIDDEIVFVSGATESLNMALKGIIMRDGHPTKKMHIITSNTEHIVVFEVLKYLERMYPEYISIDYVPVDKEGIVQVDELKQLINNDTVLVSIMLANNETGAINDIKTLCNCVKTYDNNIIFHTDASQSIGKIPVSVRDLNVDLLTIAGHKMYAPKGIGALFIKNGTKIASLIHGASSQEGGSRPGTQNVMLSVGLGKACELIEKRGNSLYHHLNAMSQKLHITILNEINHNINDDMKGLIIKVNGNVIKKLPNTLSLSFNGVSAQNIMNRIKTIVSVSAAAACHSGEEGKMSHVLQAMELTAEEANGTIRFSVGKFTTQDQVEEVGIAVAHAVYEEYTGKKKKKGVCSQ